MSVAKIFRFVLLILVFSRVGITQEIALSQSTVKNMALTRGLETELANNANAESQLGIMQAKSIYDTLLKANANYEQDRNQKTTPLFGTNNKTTNFGAELQQRTSLGTSLNLGFSNSREKTDSLFTTSPDLFSNQIYSSIRQPLAKNFLGYIDRQSIKLANKQAASTGYASQARIQGYVYQCLVAYWQLYLAQNSYTLEKAAYKKAQDLYAVNKNKKNMGLIEEADLLNFASNRDIRKSLMLEAKYNFIKAQETLAKELNIYPQLIKPSVQTEAISSKKIQSLDILLSTALEQRPDYLAQKNDVDSASISLKMAKNKMWPELDVLGSFNLNGVDSTYAQATDHLGDYHPKWQVGMELSVPFQNRSSRSALKMSTLTKKDKILNLRKVENEIINQIRTAHANYKIQRQRITSLNSAVQNSKRRLDEETNRFNQGRSDSDAIIKAETDYIETKKMLLQAQTSFRYAETDLLYAQGKILD